jgi:hypothetical protein
MFAATDQETQSVIQYMARQAEDLKVEFVQKVYSENVVHVRHDVWDVHADKNRWWVITSRTLSQSIACTSRKRCEPPLLRSVGAVVR